MLLHRATSTLIIAQSRLCWNSHDDIIKMASEEIRLNRNLCGSATATPSPGVSGLKVFETVERTQG
jgi:hypothetical protein